MDTYIPSTEYHYDYLASNVHDAASAGIMFPEQFGMYPTTPPVYGPPPINYGQPQITGPSLELHAPIPLPGQNPPLLDASVFRSMGASDPYPNKALGRTSIPFFKQQVAHDSIPAADLALCQPAPDLPINPEYCAGGDPLQTTFPTPSELLAELAAKGIPMTSDELGSDARSESASKARRRAMAKRVGFIPTDPDTISSHEKKRHYLESLEQYILYLHEQFTLINREHPPLERVNEYKGLSSRSIRTVLVHMENTTRDLNIRTLAEEERFVNLRDQVLRRERNAD